MLKVPTVISTKLGLGITSWNCRGLCSSLPYIADLLSAGCDILFLCETWLWPYDQYRLSEVHEDFESWGRADDRLDVAADKGRGYGGIGFLWKKSVAASPIGGIESDRVGGIRIHNWSVFALFGSGYGDIQGVLSCPGASHYSLGPVVVVGDFNAHLGKLAGPKGLGDANTQGVMLHDLICRCDLNAVTQGCAASGEKHTYKSGSTMTTVDYVLMDLVAASFMSSCVTLSEVDLNTSDHLPISVSLNCGSFVEPDEGGTFVKILGQC